MEPLGSQDVHSSAVVVQQYLQDVETSWTGVEAQSHLAQLSSECILLFQIILKTLRACRKSGSEERKLLEISLERSYGRMKIWSDENGAADGTLDTKLEASRDLHRDTRKYVVSISQALSERLVNVLDLDLGNAGYESVSVLRSLAAAFVEGDSDASSDSGFSDTSTGSVNSILEDLRVDTTCLLDLEPLLCSPISRKDLEPTAVLDSTRVTWSPHQPYSDKVSVRFPMAADEMVTRLGKANYARYLRCQEQKATNELSDIPSDQTASSVPDAASSKFHDSGIGSSLPTARSAYAETVMSYGEGEEKRMRVPPLPAQAKLGLPFVCLVCGKWVKIATDSAWKQHVYGDLQPWICLEAGCLFALDTFPTRNDWISHLSFDHGMDPEWRMIQCSLCRADVGPGKLLVTRHISDHLEEISLSALPVDCDGDDLMSWTSIDESLMKERDVSAPSSYWPVAEMDKFPELLRSFGTDWQAIAQYLATKTATMVKNFYTKQTGRGKPEWVQIASEADQKLWRGEKLPAPPPKPAGGWGFSKPSVEFDPQQRPMKPPISAIQQLPMSSSRQASSSQAHPTQPSVPMTSDEAYGSTPSSIFEKFNNSFGMPPAHSAPVVDGASPASSSQVFQIQKQGMHQQQEEAWQRMATPKAHMSESGPDGEVHSTLERNNLRESTQTMMFEDDCDEELVEDEGQLLDELNPTALGTEISTSPTRVIGNSDNARNEARKLGEAAMTMGKGAMLPFDEPRISPRHDTMLSTELSQYNTCVFCCARKVLCDGQGDICSNCIRLGFTCSYDESILKVQAPLADTMSNSASLDPRPSEPPEGPQYHSSLTPEETRAIEALKEHRRRREEAARERPTGRDAASLDRARQFMGAWVEPERARLASFQEDGLVRQGVLEMMEPLGSRPKPAMFRKLLGANSPFHGSGVFGGRDGSSGQDGSASMATATAGGPRKTGGKRIVLKRKNAAAAGDNGSNVQFDMPGT